jgi:hypothetical protein
MENKTLIEKFKAIQKIGTEVQVPWEVSHCIQEQQRPLSISSDQVCIGEDYVSLDQARAAIAWYVTQLGGKVKWD